MGVPQQGRFLDKNHRKPERSAMDLRASIKLTLLLAGILLGISAADSIFALATDTRSSGASINAQSKLDRLPNILLISSYGIDANRTSIYGSERDTTPFDAAMP